MALIVTHLSHPYIDEQALAEEFPTVYHYTSAKNLSAILQSGGLWASHYESLNDSTEFRFASAEVARAILTETGPAIRKALRARPWMKKRIKQLGNKLEDIIEEDAMTLPTVMLSLAEVNMPMHVLSLAAHASSNERSGGILTLWREYGRDRGIALGFSTLALLAALGSHRARQRIHAAYLSKVTYGSGDSLFQDRLAGLSGMSEIYQSLSLPMIAGKKPTKVIEHFNETAVKFLTTSILHKHPAFCDEREIRLVMAPLVRTELDERSEPPWAEQMPGTSKLVVDCVPALTEVLIGPSANQSEIEQAVIECLREAGKPDLAVVRSDIPYRPKSS